MGKSIYESIENALKNGNIESLRVRKDVFADGAPDGMYMYHMNPAENDEAVVKKIEAVLKKACTGNYDKADKMYLEIGKSTIELIDDIQDTVYNISKDINSDKLWLYLEHLIFETDNSELVKLALSIIEIFDIDDDDDLKGYIRTLSNCNEFSLFTIFIMRKWSDSANEIFQVAKAVSGWGRIHAVSYLPEDISDEIKLWLVEYGWYNKVMIEYTGLTVFVKGEAEKILKSDNVSDRALEGIGNLVLIGIMDNPSPVDCIDSLDNFEEIKNIWIEKATNSTDEKVQAVLNDINSELKIQ